MKDWKDILIEPNISILQAIEIIDRGAVQITFVVDCNGRLLGTVSDGDVRRGILKGISMTDPVSLIMNQKPIVAGPDISKDKLREIMGKKEIRQIPIVDTSGKILRIETWLDTIRRSPKNNPVVLMAGGIGKRLGALTAGCPKPLLKVGDKPILQTILESFAEVGFHNFYLAVNYRADMIKAYFSNGERWGVQIQYLLENDPLGTAGALSLMPQKPTEPIIVMNGDILTKIDFEQLLGFHKETKSTATMCIRDYQIQVPYGVVEIEESRLVTIQEKPVHQCFVSAGIYVLDPDVLEWFPIKSKIDMPEVFHIVMGRNLPTSVFPIREYWIDIGHVDDYEKANGDYPGVFA